MDFFTLRLEAGLNRDKAAKLFEVTPRTIRNWDTGKRKPPRAVFLYLHVLCGHLDHMNEHWKGFRFHHDCLLSPEGEHLWSWEVRAIKYLFHAAGINRYRLDRAMTTKKENTPAGDNIKIFRRS